MRSLKESLLADIEDTLDKGESDILNLDTLPTIKDFTKQHNYNGNYYEVNWYCPDILYYYGDIYKSIKGIKLNNYDTIKITLYPLKSIYGKTWGCEFMLSNKKIEDLIGVVLINWTSLFYNESIQTCKKKVIQMLNYIAKNIDVMYKFMKCINDNYGVVRIGKPNISDLTKDIIWK